MVIGLATGPNKLTTGPRRLATGPKRLPTKLPGSGKRGQLFPLAVGPDVKQKSNTPKLVQLSPLHPYALAQHVPLLSQDTTAGQEPQYIPGAASGSHAQGTGRAVGIGDGVPLELWRVDDDAASMVLPAGPLKVDVGDTLEVLRREELKIDIGGPLELLDWEGLKIDVGDSLEVLRREGVKIDIGAPSEVLRREGLDVVVVGGSLKVLS